MATAARRTANLNSLYTTAVESWYENGKAEEIIYEPTPLLWILSQTAKKTGNWSYDILVRLLESKNNNVDSFEYYDTVSTAPSKGTQAARFSLANYSAPIAISWQEEIENKEPHAIADRVQTAVEQAELSMAERLAQDLYKGNIVKSTNVLGLENMIPAFKETGSLGAHTGGWQYRQATNTWGNITRTAWTSATAGGTGWEPLSVDFNGNSANRIQYVSATGIADTGMLELQALYNFTSRGIVHPDLIIASNAPFRDYENACAHKMQIVKESASFGDVQLGFDNLKYKNCTMIRDEMATTRNATASIGDCTFGEENLYMLNTKFMKLYVEEGVDFTLGVPRMPVDQHATVMHIVWRGQIINVNPRYSGRIYNYPA